MVRHYLPAFGVCPHPDQHFVLMRENLILFQYMKEKNTQSPYSEGNGPPIPKWSNKLKTALPLVTNRPLPSGGVNFFIGWTSITLGQKLMLRPVPPKNVHFLTGDK